MEKRKPPILFVCLLIILLYRSTPDHHGETHTHSPNLDDKFNWSQRMAMSIGYNMYVYFVAMVIFITVKTFNLSFKK